MQLLTFVVHGQPCAVPIEPVREIIEVPDLTPVPLMPPVLRGVMNLRGTVIPVLDLGERLGLGPTPKARRTCVVLFDVHQPDQAPMVMGAMVDAVQEVVDVEPERIDAPVAFGAPFPIEFMRGMARLSHGIVMLIDLDRVLSLGDLDVLAPAGSALAS